jgi:photosystem II stability/assembly factor-like uncharacterized protein
MDTVRVLVGTRKGAFILEADGRRAAWQLRGPFCETWPVNHVLADPDTGWIHAAGGSPWCGPAVWTSRNGGETWGHSREGLTYGAGEDPVQSVWSLARGPRGLYAGVEPAGLFLSRDGGQTFEHLRGLRDHPSRPDWHAGGAGLILHSVVFDPEDEGAIWVGISAAGVFFSRDGGLNWEPRNRGTRADFMPEGQNYPEFGQCVHCITRATGMRDRLYQQNHCGMYRSDDGGRSWQSIENGLPSSFGFPAAAHPRDPDTLFLVPLNGDIKGRYMPDAAAAVWRTRDGGRTWQDLREGLPQKDAYLTVLRQALAVDHAEPAGVYFGTSSGSVYASADEGETWACIAQNLPAISSIETWTPRR